MQPFNFLLVILLGILSICGGTIGTTPKPVLVDELLEPEDPGNTPDTPIQSSADPADPVEVITGTADCACGRSPLSARIVGGELAKINEYPWTVAVVRKDWGLVFCGGTLICDRYVATAAHCLKYVASPEDIQVYLMEEDFEVENENAQPTLKIDVVEFIVHPDWSAKHINNDITLLKLATPVDISQAANNKMVPACVPAKNDRTFAGKVATVAGWGALQHGRQVVSQLRKVDVPIFEQEECRSKTKYKKVLTENMLCAGYLEGQKDACSGDSGGPLVLQENGRFLHVGIVSFGYKCAYPNAPGVYARVSRYGDWIRENTKDCQYCSR